MKKLIKLYTGILLLLGCSCNSWLDVDLVNQVEEERLFSTEQGFKEALAGVYSKMSKSAMYGQNLTFGIMDVFAQQYDYSSMGNSYKVFRDYNYEDETVKSAFVAFWSNQYKAIASVNNILRWADQNGGVMRESTRKQVIGEAYALRAFLHFDIYRMFAPDVKTNEQAAVVPYNRTFGVELPSVYTGKQFLALVHEDLQSALGYLEEDPIHALVPYQLWDNVDADKKNKDAADQYVARMNYFAVKALMARVYLAEGEYKLAREAAQEVIGCGKFHLVDIDKSVAVNDDVLDVLFSDEHIFSLRNKSIVDYTKSLNIVAEDLTGRVILSVPSTNSYLYGSNNDVRFWKWFDTSNKLTKYHSGNTKRFTAKVPMIRLAEMYLIAAEGWLNEDAAKAREILQELRDSRLREDEGEMGEVTMETLVSEMRREYFGEGQLFFAYKRLNHVIIRDTGEGNVPASESVFIFPLPDGEVDNGNRQTYN